MGQNVDIPALLAQIGEITDGGFAAGQEDEVSVERQRMARLHDLQCHVWGVGQRVEVIEIGDA